MKNHLPESLNLRSLILENFEQALLTVSISRKDALMNFVIVGGAGQPELNWRGLP